MTLSIMQPYLFPYLGYFQLLNKADHFIIYDNIEFTKKGWINRNRILLNKKDVMFTIPLKKDSDYLTVNERYLSADAPKEISKILGQIKSSYSKAPCFKTVFPLIEDIFLYEEMNLFNYIFNSIRKVSQYLEIATELRVSSTIAIDHTLKGKNKVIELCKKMGADIYLNPIGGLELYNKDEFRENGIDLQFHRMEDIVYQQGNNDFLKSLSIIDVMMFNPRERVKAMLHEFALI